MIKPANGSNPMRWDCVSRGCFNKLKRPKIEIFCDCFPRRINFGDVDGQVELNGRLLAIEWKESRCPQIPMGQDIMYKKVTQGGLITVFCIAGNPETMEVWLFRRYWNGKPGEWVACNLEQLKERIKRWANWATNNPAHWPTLANQ